MIIVNIRMELLPGKRAEFLHAIGGIRDATGKEKGCLSNRICRDIENENLLYAIEVWESQKDLDTHWQSDTFSAFLGSKHLLRISPQIWVHEVSNTVGMEAISAVREK